MSLKIKITLSDIELAIQQNHDLLGVCIYVSACKSFLWLQVNFCEDTFAIEFYNLSTFITYLDTIYS